MKIPTQQNKVKKTALVVAGVAVVAGLAVPTATFAQGQGRESMPNGSSWDRGNHGNSHNGNSWDRGSWSWWEKISAEDFTSWNTNLLSKIDWYIQKNGLEVQNGVELRAAVDADTAELAENLTTLQELRDSTGDISEATDEQRAALKEQSTATFSSYYDYKLSFYDYKVAIKAAADNKGVKIDSSIDSQAQ